MSTITIRVNGESQSISRNTSIAGLLVSLSLVGKRLAVELNGEIVPKSLHETTLLSNSDELEIVVAVGGG